MKRYFQYNAVAAIALLACFFGLKVLNAKPSSQVDLALLGVFLIAFYGASHIALMRQFRWTFLFSILSAAGWIIVTLFLAIELYALIYGTADLM
jgi:hypothetical protein